MIDKAGFNKWFEEYFCNVQGEDSPYRYEDVITAWNTAYSKGKDKYKQKVTKAIKKLKVKDDWGFKVTVEQLEEELGF